MIRETLCGWSLWLLCLLFGMETFSIAAACSLPEPVLVVLNEYIREVQV